MKVSVITPTANRYHLLKRCVEQFEAQDYANKELIIGDGSDTALYYNTIPDRRFMNRHTIITLKGLTLGIMRNNLCGHANGEIILHMDDDDIYAPDWITKSVEALLSSGGGCTGLSKAYFRHGEQWYLYKAQENAQPYVCGATMCYFRELWMRNPFNNVNRGEDLQFQTNAGVRAHNYINGFTATIHGDNIASYSKILGSREFSKIVMPAPLAL